ncbi:MAG: S8 family serine peptidase [Bacteroidota bacterium]
MYTYHYGNQKHHLVEAQDLVVVRTEKDAKPLERMDMSTTSRSLVPHMMPIMAFPEANVTIYKVVGTPEHSALSLRNSIRRELSAEDHIKFAGRALRDPKTGTIYVYTENLFVKFSDDVPAAECEAMLTGMKLEISETLPFAGNAYFVKAKAGTGAEVFNLAEQLLAHDQVESCHPELVGQKIPKAAYPLQWHLIETRIRGRLINQHVNIEEAWEHSKGSGTTIAILDDGVDTEHLEFQSPGKIVAPRNTVWNTNDARPVFPSDNHGTACAGVACADGKDKASGVAPEARLMPIKIGGLGSLAEAKAFAWAADNGADVISCSWGPPDGKWWDQADPLHTSYAPLPDSTRYALDYALREGRGGKGCVIIWAGGNGNEEIKYDGYASYDNVIAVAACNDRGKRSIYSDFGEAIWCAFPSSDQAFAIVNHPRPLTAGIWTVDRSDNEGYNEGGINAEEVIGDLDGHYTATFGGTSSACPGVAGVVALMLAANPELTWQEVKTIIKGSCDQIDEEGGAYDAEGHSPYYGYGRINAGKAVQNAIAASGKEHIELNVQGFANFKDKGQFSLQEGEWLGTSEGRDRMLGFLLCVKPFQPQLSLEYRVKANNRPLEPWLPVDTYAGTFDRRRKLIGFGIRLTGPLADQYDIHYQALLQGEDEPAEGSNGSTCGTENKRGDAIEGIRVWIEKRL